MKSRQQKPLNNELRARLKVCGSLFIWKHDLPDSNTTRGCSCPYMSSSHDAVDKEDIWLRDGRGWLSSLRAQEVLGRKFSCKPSTEMTNCILAHPYLTVQVLILFLESDFRSEVVLIRCSLKLLLGCLSLCCSQLDHMLLTETSGRTVVLCKKWIDNVLWFQS